MLVDTLLNYWTTAQYLRGLKTPEAKEVFRRCKIVPAVERATDPKMKELLERLLAA